MKNFFLHVYRYFSKRWGLVWFSAEKPPLAGDSITVNNLRATFETVSVYEMEKAVQMLKNEESSRIYPVIAKVNCGSILDFTGWVKSTTACAIKETEDCHSVREYYGLPVIENRILPRNKVVLVDSNGNVASIFTIPVGLQ